jgi:PhoH-like ATPase
MKSFEKIYILDTNIILNDSKNLIKISQNGNNLIVLPETVIDEIDSKKTGFDEINFQAREFGRILDESVVESKTKTEEYTIIRLNLNGIIIDTISLNKYNIQNETDKSIINDRKIIQVGEFSIKHYNQPEETILLTLDVMCRLRSISKDVQCETLSYNKKEKEHKFIKHIPIQSIFLNSLNFKNIIDIDSEYTIENYCYMFEAETGHNIPAIIVNGTIQFLDENELRKNDIKPKNLGQMYAMSGMLNPIYNLCLIDALAGSGKTLLAISCGMRMIDLGHYDKIIYIRNSIESVDKGEDVGYLPGLVEKFKIYNHPLYDTIEFMARNSSKQKEKATEQAISEKIEQLIEKYSIETLWIGEARGRTISRSFVIIDEIQNFSRKSLQTILTRLDDDCKVICIGSNRQIDNQWVNKYTNGLSLLLDSTDKEHPEIKMFATTLDKVVRGKITEWAERIFFK